MKLKTWRPSFVFVDAWRTRLALALQPQLAPLQARWQSLPLRDQRALLLMGLALLLAAGWFLLLQPAMRYADESRRDLERAHADLQWMQANAAQARQAPGGALPGGQNLLAAVNADARQAGLNPQRFEPEGTTRVRITLENAVFTDVLRWVVGLESRYGIKVEHFQAEAQQAGVANIRLTLMAP